MIHDYKFKIAAGNRDRRRISSRGLTFILAGGVLATAFLLRHIDLEAGQSVRLEPTRPVTTNLALPSSAWPQTDFGQAGKPNAGVRSEALTTRPPSSYRNERSTTGFTNRPETPDQKNAATAPDQAKVAAMLDTSVSQQRTKSATSELLPTQGTKTGDSALAAEPEPKEGTLEDASADFSDPINTFTRTQEYRIASGDNLAKLFSRAHLSASLLHRIVHSSDAAANIAKIRPGQTLRLAFDANDELRALTLQRNKISSLEISLEDDEITATEHRADLEHRTAHATGVIESSLFVDGQKAGLDDSLIMELAAIFGWDIDFALEIRAGDRFSVVYEELFLDDEKVRNGPILAAEFVNRGVEYRAVRFETDDGNVAYYDPEGRNKRRAFIRTPVKFARVSSGFTTRRWHPLLKRWRSHKGVDYAAPTGTPIKATGAGRVIFRGRKGGYGRVVFIEHAQKYTTVYGHMSRFARSVKTGSRVKQGQVIGYVGQSGLATGPHLHYEFRVNGVHRNPLTVKLPKSLPLPENKLAAFHRATQPLLAKLDELSQATLVADAHSHAQ